MSDEPIEQMVETATTEPAVELSDAERYDAQFQRDEEYRASLNAPVQEAAPKRKGGLLDGLRSFMETEEQKLERARADVEERRAQLRGIEEQYKSLLQKRDGIPRVDGNAPIGGLKNRLALADAEFESYKARRKQLTESLHTMWWGESERVGSSPESGYAALLALEAAIDDYPTARKVIAAQLAELERQIAAFERKHLSNILLEA